MPKSYPLNIFINEKLFQGILKINFIKMNENYASVSETSKMCSLGQILIFTDNLHVAM